MTRKEAEKILKAAEEEAGPRSWDTYKNRIATGLMILAKYDPEIDLHIGFEHDVIYASSWTQTRVAITPEDVRELGLHDWFINEDERWVHY